LILQSGHFSYFNFLINLSSDFIFSYPVPSARITQRYAGITQKRIIGLWQTFNKSGYHPHVSTQAEVKRRYFGRWLSAPGMQNWKKWEKLPNFSQNF